MSKYYDNISKEIKDYFEILEPNFPEWLNEYIDTKELLVRVFDNFIVDIYDNEGKLIPIGKVRGRKKSLLELADLMDSKIGSYAKSCDTIFISHGDCREEAEFFSKKIKEKYQIKTEVINYVGAVIGAHSGPGTMALFFVGDVR